MEILTFWEQFALQLAKKANVKIAVVADFDDFSYVDPKTLGRDRLAIFLLATYREGAPIDNAIEFETFLKTESASADAAFQLQYAIFGLPNSFYHLFNEMATRTDSALQSRGATRIGQVGMGDDGKASLDEDFTMWQD